MVRYGDFGGKDVVYDDQGRLIIRPNETVLLTSSEQNIYARCLSPKRKHPRILEPTKESGLLYITNQRIVFIRRPDPWLAAWRDLTPVGIGDAVAKAMMARDLRALKACYYIEIPLHEIVSAEVKRGKYATIIAADASEKVLLVLNRKNRADNKLIVLTQVLATLIPH